MKAIVPILIALGFTSSPTWGADAVVKQFLRYIYGAHDVELSAICHPSDDLWMLQGARNPAALAEVDLLRNDARSAGVFSGLVGTDLYFIEVRDGKVDPLFNLAQVYVVHRQLVLGFIYAVLSRDERMLARMVTDPAKVEIVGPQAAHGEMGQYASVIELMPVVRSSRPPADAKSETVTYRVPVGNEALSLTIAKQGSTWKIDTSKTVSISLEFFFR